MKWKEEYELGFTEIDKQHKTLVECINNYKNNLSDKNSKNIITTLQFLVNYASHHFQAEENLMESIDYTNLKSHTEIHKNIVSQLREKILKFKISGININLELYYFLVSWLNEHILVEDMKIKKFCKKNNSKIIKTNSVFISKEDTISNVITKLDLIDQEIKLKNIKEEDRDFRRLIILQEYLEEIFPEEPSQIKEIFKSFIELVECRVLTTEELNILYSHFSMDNLNKKLNSKGIDSIIEEELNYIKKLIEL